MIDLVNRSMRRSAVWVIGTLICLSATSRASALKIGDICHLQGSRTNPLTGLGLVVGLNGTGDGGRFAPSIQMLAQLYTTFANPVFSMDQLKDVKNVAIVTIQVELPEGGTREGERLDVQVSSHAAKSLNGGRLLMTPLISPNPNDDRIFAFAGGPLQIDNAEIPTVARVSRGATLEQNWIHTYIVRGSDLPTQVQARPWIRDGEPYVTFVIDEPHAEWAVASTIAQSINEESSIPEVSTGNTSSQIAMAFDTRTVIVRVPPEERNNPAPFLARLEGLQLFMPYTEARVTIQRNSGTIVITGDAKISPVMVAHKGLSITTVVPMPEPDPNNPQVKERQFIALDPQRKGTSELRDLLDALDQLRVPAADKITILEQLHRTGKLHAKLMVEQ
jgi:flagellar P-ring protein precursor FlgI